MISSMLDTPIASIYDMMVERHLKLRRESELKEAGKGTSKLTRRLKEERSIAEEKKAPIKSKSNQMKMPSLYRRECDSPPPANAITAAHLTKKQTALMVQPPSEKEVIKKLVEKISKGRVRSKPESSDPKSSKTKLVVSGRRRKMVAQRSLSSKQKLAKSNSSQMKSLPLSPRNEERGPKDVKPQAKTPKMKTSKTSEKKTRLQVHSSKVLDPSGKATGSRTNRWRV
ncbi:uncharacterized protein LOC108040971 [Drosophila rhopaloa]|uniref:Uncharacterized protein LOC108040971 n=1 Tax=Drosophila rhopaloa TaxID=1041015 RepID=A0A6P4E860_DRORH|nr:uncharacterized protein LOC108040971 [Drosophila rhopaloa]